MFVLKSLCVTITLWLVWLWSRTDKLIFSYASLSWKFILTTYFGLFVPYLGYVYFFLGYLSLFKPIIFVSYTGKTTLRYLNKGFFFYQMISDFLKGSSFYKRDWWTLFPMGLVYIRRNSGHLIASLLFWNCHSLVKINGEPKCSVPTP